MLDRPRQSAPASFAAAAAPLLMLPGTLCDGRVFAPVLSRLGLDADCLPLAGAESAAALAQLLLADAPERFSLCGFSLGGIVALEIIAQAPERVDRLALIGCNAGVLDAEARAARSLRSKSDFLAGETSPLLRQMADATPDATYRQQTAITLSRADSRPRLHRIAVPTLVLCGANDRICSPALSRQIANAIPHSHLRVIPGAGHYVLLEAPDAVSVELLAWLATPSPPSTEGPGHGR